MRILIHNVEAATQRRDLRQLAIKETGPVIRRLRWLLPRIKLVLSKLEPAHGEVDKRCVVEMKSSRTATVVVTALARDWMTAMKSALRLASQRVSELRQVSASSPPALRLQRVPVRRVADR